MLRFQAARLGTAITELGTGFGDDGELIETLMQLNGALNGLFMLGDSLFDHDAQPVAGPACDS